MSEAAGDGFVKYLIESERNSKAWKENRKYPPKQPDMIASNGMEAAIEASCSGHGEHNLPKGKPLCST